MRCIYYYFFYCILLSELRIQIRIRIRRIRMFLSLLDPDPSITKQNSKKNLDSYRTALWLLFWLFIFEKWCKCSKQKNFFKRTSFLLASWRSMTKIAGSGSRSTLKCHGSATMTIFINSLNGKWPEHPQPPAAPASSSVAGHAGPPAGPWGQAADEGRDRPPPPLLAAGRPSPTPPSWLWPPVLLWPPAVDNADSYSYFGNVFNSVGDPWLFAQDPTPFFSDFKDANNFFSFFSYNLPTGTLSSVLKILIFFAKVLC